MPDPSSGPPSNPAWSVKTRTLNRVRSVLVGREPIERLLASRPRRWRTLDAALLKVAPNHYQYDERGPRVVEREGAHFEVRLDEYHGWCIFYAAPDRSRDALLDLVSVGDHCIDVGANLGEFALRVAQRVGDGGRVLAVEPFPATHERLVRNLELNPALAERISVERRALAASGSDVVTMSSGRGDNTGTAHVAVGGDAPHACGAVDGGRATVATATLDLVVRDAGLARVDVVKVDVEGYELQVLRGAEETIAEHRPVLFVEVDDRYLDRAGSSVAELMAWFEAHGYALSDAYSACPVSTTEPWPAGRHTDVVAHPLDAERI